MWYRILFVLLFGLSELYAIDHVVKAQQNGLQAQQALVRSNRVLHAYLKRLDPVTGLLPRRGDNYSWYVRDSAADLYPFLVMAAYYTDRDIYNGQMHEILRNEILYSTRIGMLSDNVKPGGEGFEHDDIDLDRIIFGSCEYAKDGLLPLTELLGHHAWFDRMLGIVDDMIKQAPYETPYGRIPSNMDEVNGEFLQVLSRLAYLTRNPHYIDQALAICDFYFKEVIPKSNGLPAHVWDLENGKPETDMFNYADHGNEIIGGLAEFVLFLKQTDNPHFEDFKLLIVQLVDRLLEKGLNSDGVWYSKIAPSTGEIIDKRHAHCWGYLFNAVYTTYLISGEERFLAATKRALNTVTEIPTYLDDPSGSGRNYGSNAYSDALESAIVFLNRLPNDKSFQILDEAFDRFLKRQREDGIIEDWYGDGNYVRTALMYALLKSQGTWIEPWRSDVQLGAVAYENELLIILEGTEPWEGVLRFDRQRHRLFFNLPVNYPRLNEFPEWFIVDEDALYEIDMNNTIQIFTGGELAKGIKVKTKPNETLILKVNPMPGPPYGVMIQK